MILLHESPLVTLMLLIQKYLKLPLLRVWKMPSVLSFFASLKALDRVFRLIYTSEQ